MPDQPVHRSPSNQAKLLRALAGESHAIPPIWLMRQAGLKGCPKRRFRRIKGHLPSYPIAHNLLQQDFTASQANEHWASDITYISTRQGWLYLAVVMDLFSRRIVGWSMDRRTGRHLVIDAMNMALDQRDVPEVHHSDRGPQYTSDDFRELLSTNGIECTLWAGFWYATWIAGKAVPVRRRRGTGTGSRAGR